MNQLVVLQEIYESTSAGGDALLEADPGSIDGSCSLQVGQLLERARRGEIDEELCRKLSDSLEDVFEIKRLGDICRRAGFYALAIKCYNKALSTTRDQTIRPVLLNNLGQVYSRQGDPGRAAVYYQKAADGFLLIGDKSGLAHILGNLAASYRRSREWDKAVEHCYRSQKIFEEIGDEFGAAQMTGSLGRIYAEMDERDLAARYFEKSLRDFQRLGDKKSVARILDRMGRICAKSRSWDDAVSYYGKSLAILDELGLERSSSVVLSNLGRMYLEKGDAPSARDSLEKALKIMRKDMQPAYQNAVAALAASYSLAARACLEEADELESRLGQLTAKSTEKHSEALLKASENFSRSSDMYQRLSSFPKTDLQRIKVAASVARGLSYISKLQLGPSEAEAVSLIERAIQSLENGVANSEGRERAGIVSLQKTLCGMKGVWSIALLETEPWRMTESLAGAIEYMLGGACGGSEACRCLCDALHCMSGAVESEKRRDSPTEQLKAAASHLRRAEKRLLAESTNKSSVSALQVGLAADRIEEFANQDISRSNSSQSRISDSLNYKVHREALLLIGWALARDAIRLVDDTPHVFAWDESFNLIDGSSKANGEIGTEIRTATAEAGLEVEDEEELLQDALDNRAGTLHEEPGGVWLTPLNACLAQQCASAQVPMTPEEHAWNTLWPAPTKSEIIDPSIGDQPAAADDGKKGRGIDKKETKGNENARKGKTGGNPERDSIKEAGEELRAWKEGLLAVLGDVINPENGMKAVRALSVVVLVLLAIRAILYLI